MQTPSCTTELHEFGTEPTSEKHVVIWKLVSSRLALGMILKGLVAIFLPTIWIRDLADFLLHGTHFLYSPEVAVHY